MVHQVGEEQAYDEPIMSHLDGVSLKLRPNGLLHLFLHMGVYKQLHWIWMASYDCRLSIVCM